MAFGYGRHFLLRRCILKHIVVECVLSAIYIQMVQKIYTDGKNEDKCGKIVIGGYNWRAYRYCCTIIPDL